MAATSVLELQPVHAATEKLQQLLQQARLVKQDTNIEPPLPISPFKRDIDALHDGFGDQYDQAYRFSAVETAAREIFYSLITSTDISDPAFVVVWNLLDIVLMCGDNEKCTCELVCYLLEELLDSQTTDGCKKVFDYLDSRRDRLAQKDFNKKNLIFLRSCNELLRRLSRAEDAIFCGRVFFFLFQTFPLGDKSSVNLRGEFHTENATHFDVTEPSSEQIESSQMDVDRSAEEDSKKPETPQATTGKPGSKAVPIKAPPRKTQEEEILSTSELYPIFWKLQQDFSDPTRLFDAENLAVFKKGLANTIAKFKKTPTVVQTKVGEDNKRGTKRKLAENGVDSDSSGHMVDNYNPRYLTSRDLFDLELSDLAFQRHILVQALILLDFLLSLTERAKKRLSDLSTPNKSMLYAFTLGEEESKWATSVRSNITLYLSASTEGRQYHRMVETVLARDKNWIRWKVESCPSIVRGPVETSIELGARKGAREATRPRRVPDKPMSAMDLSFLDEASGGGLEALKNPSRFVAPTLDQLLETVKTDKLDLEMAFDDDERTSIENAIQNATWRGLRQSRISDLSLLNKVQSGNDLEDMLKAVEQHEPDNHEHNGDDNVPSIALNADESLVPEPRSAEEDQVMKGEDSK